MSGGQMQRVAIARALVNDPDILLADEPTGALDSETSVQVMEILKNISKDRLIIMVTHNPELAETYASRIVRLKDGEIVDDSAPYEEAVERKSLRRRARSKKTINELWHGAVAVAQQPDDEKGTDVFNGLCRQHRYYRHRAHFIAEQWHPDLYRPRAGRYAIELSA